MLVEETGDMDEFVDFYDYHIIRWLMIETHPMWFSSDSSIYNLFRFAWSCGYIVQIQFAPKI